MPARLLSHLRRLSLPGGVRTTTPDMVRSWMKGNSQAATSYLEDLGLRSGQGGPSEAARLLRFCVSDIQVRTESSVTRLIGLGCVPVADGSFANISSPSGSPLFLVSPDEQKLLAVGRKSLGPVIVDGEVTGAMPGLDATLQSLAASGWLNLRRLAPVDLAEFFLPALLPVPKQGSHVVASAEGPGAEWLGLLWRCLADCKSLRPFEVARLPLVPTTGGCLHVLAPLPRTALLQAPSGQSSARICGILQALGCHLLAKEEGTPIHEVRPKQHAALLSWTGSRFSPIALVPRAAPD